jgi:RNA polymerase sigma-70 factor (ECF subfamily)
MKDLNDRELVERTLAGEREAFGALFERYRYLVFRMAINRLGDAEAANDATQETFLTAYKNLDRLRHPEAFGAWAAQIARNTCANIRRKRGIKSVSLDYLHEAGYPPGRDDDPADKIHQAERLGAVRAAVAALPKKYRDVIELHYTRECSYEKTARFLGLSVTNVRARLHRARRMIVQRLEHEGLL